MNTWVLRNDGRAGDDIMGIGWRTLDVLVLEGNVICATSFATMILFGNLKESETSTLIMGETLSMKKNV